MLFGYYGSADELAVYKQVGDLYKKKNPHVKLEYTYADPLGFFQKLPLLFRSGAAPDVFMAAESWISGLAQLGGYADLRADLDRSGISESVWLPGALNAGKVGGKILALPVIVYPKGIGYNQTLFEKYHVPLPDPSWRQDDFLHAAQTITDQGRSDGVWGMNNSFGTTQPYDLVTLYGGMIFNYETRQMTATEPAVVNAVRFGRDLMRKYKVMPNAAQTQALLAGFPTGRFAMDIFAGYDMQPWDAQIGNKFKWNIAPYPREWRGTYQNNNVAISAKSHNRQAAWELAKFIATDPDAQQVQGQFATPAVRTSAQRWLTALPTKYSRLHWQPLLDRLHQQEVAYQGGEFTKVWDVMGQQVQSVEELGTDPMKAMQTVQKRGTSILSTQRI